MKTTVALIIKLVGTLAAAWISFMIFGMAAFWTVFTIGIAVTVLNYLIGDLVLLPRWGNIWASIVDGIIAGATAWVVLYYIPAAYDFIASIWVFALIIAVAEYFYHIYLISANIVEKKKSDSDFYKKNKVNYNTETGSELFPYGKKNFSDNHENSADNEYYKNTDQYSDTGYDSNFTSDAGGRDYGSNYKSDVRDYSGAGFSRSSTKSKDGDGHSRSGKNSKK